MGKSTKERKKNMRKCVEGKREEERKRERWEKRVKEGKTKYGRLTQGKEEKKRINDSIELEE